MTMVWTLSKIDSIERTNLYVAGALCAGSVYFLSLSVTLGVGLGAFIVVANFRWLRRLVERAMAKGGGLKKRVFGEYALKMVLFLVVPCAVVYYREYIFDINPVAFVVGLSTVFIAIFVEGIRGVFKEAR
jgi:hypothetical protein